VADEAAAVREDGAVSDELVALGLARVFRGVAAEDVQHDLYVTLQRVQVNWNEHGAVLMYVKI